MLHDQPDFLFRQTPAQLRRIGARGGRACARAVTAQPQKPVPTVARLAETTAEAIATLDLQFPWLRGAEHCLCPRHQDHFPQAPHSPTRPRVAAAADSPPNIPASPAPEYS